ncbi:hypothetical protein P2H44_06475 [Albimonas sp. CAU 1670]|uniref:hypothetical protein n=1 Tax=Albimonas sp. CAU 1670 TaxID=3032599 RepID=UPI0023DC1C2B|nr:hypothetical protein [Albimonas sp. CAU 1670]MDF2232195.1 hypothetical protein [Albimonas sp. CAU 1670]
MCDRDFRPGWWVIPTLAIEAAVVAVAMVGCAVKPAKAQATVVCGEYVAMAAALRAHGEAPVFRGLDVRGFVAEAWASPGGRWTWLSAAPDGRACLVAAGEAGGPIALEPEERQG